MIRIFRITLILLVSFCSILIFSDHFRIKAKHKTTDPKLQEYVDIINALSNGKLGHNKIKLGFFSSKKYTTLIGACKFSLNNLEYEIDISSRYWRTAGYRSKLLLVAHELVHCECGHFKHNNDKFLDGCPISVMHESSILYDCRKKHFKHYLKEISKGCNAHL